MSIVEPGSGAIAAESGLDRASPSRRYSSVDHADNRRRSRSACSALARGRQKRGPASATAVTAALASALPYSRPPWSLVPRSVRPRLASTSARAPSRPSSCKRGRSGWSLVAAGEAPLPEGSLQDGAAAEPDRGQRSGQPAARLAAHASRARRRRALRSRRHRQAAVAAVDERRPNWTKRFPGRPSSTSRST